ncbi:Paf1 complex component [Kickxella alabastrina]|uniref:Paf1 complex component n=1 Tax=Kickxella alabastrina TaxID=61397 RepID=A0ACC1IW51_9FUNG|nr:Paf1 complex component [Kickxella alabastrina]
MSDLFGSDISDGEGSLPRTPQPAISRARGDQRQGSRTPDPQRDDGLFGSDNDDDMPRRGRPATSNDLFGSDSEAEAEAEAEDKNARNRMSSSQHSSDGDMEVDQEAEVKKVQVRVMSARVPVLPVPRSSDKFIMARTPNLLQLDSTPYTASAHEDLIAEEHNIAQKHGIKSAVTAELASAVEGILANTVRWRQVPGPGGPIRQSNARLVRWSDGSTTVAIAGESYSITEESLADANCHAAAHYSREQILQSHARLTDQWLLRPSRQSAQSRLAVSLLLGRVRAKASGDQPQDRTRSTRTRFMVVDENPDLVVRRAEVEEERRERMRRREEKIRERKEARELQTGSGYRAAYDEDREAGYASEDYHDAGLAARSRVPRRATGRPTHAAAPLPRAPARGSYADEDDDGFIVDDDDELEVGPRDEFDEEEDEEELAARRLTSAKRTDYSDESDVPARSAKPRRLVSDDEDDM